MILKAVAYFCNSLSETRERFTTEGVDIQLYTERVQEIFPVVIATGFHLFPFRTEKLSPTAPMVLHTRGRVGRRHFRTSLETRKRLGALLRLDESEGELEYETAERTDSEQVCHFQLVSLVSVRSALSLHLVLFLVRQSSEFLFVHAFAFEECQTVNRER